MLDCDGCVTRADGRWHKLRVNARNRPPYRFAWSTARRARAVPGWRAGRRRAPADGWRRNGARRAASPCRAGRARRARRAIASCTMRGESGPPRAPTNSGAVVRQIERAKRDIVGDQFGDLRQHRHHARLVALAGDGDGVARADVLALERERFRDAQARAVEQAQHGGVAGDDPRLARLRRRADSVSAMRLAAAIASGFGSVLADLGRAHGGERADLALAVALQEARERAGAGQHPHQRAAAQARRCAAPP